MELLKVTEALKAAIEFLSRHETVVKDYDGVMVTSGSQQIMDFYLNVYVMKGI